MSTMDMQGLPSPVEAAEIAEALGVDWPEVPFDLARFRAGLRHELERSRAAAAEGPDTVACGRLALARLHEDPDYYGTGVEPEPTAPPT